MLLLWEKNSIIQSMQELPDRVHRLWVEQGYEHVSDEVIKEAKRLGVPFRVIPREAFARKFKASKSHVCLERDEITYADPDMFLKGSSSRHDPVVCAFDGIYDPQNLGNIMRSAACLEIDGIIIPKDRACGITETVATVSRGGTERVTVVRVVNLARYLSEMKKSGFFCYGLDERGTVPLWEADLTGHICLVFGNESGLRRLTKDTCDQVLKIPTSHAFSSLNVATSFAIAVYEAKRQRLHKTVIRDR
jgi:23S rRNA (guanosine2251-2'-O)-methyltransferase